MPYTTASGGDSRVPSSSLRPHHSHPETVLPFPTSPTSTATRSLTRTEQGAMGTLWRDRRRGWDAVG